MDDQISTDNWANITRWIPAKGYGFAVMYKGKIEVFVHVSAFSKRMKKNCDLTGAVIEILSTEEGPKGLSAKQVKFTGGLLGLYNQLEHIEPVHETRSPINTVSTKTEVVRLKNGAEIEKISFIAKSMLIGGFQESGIPGLVAICELYALCKSGIPTTPSSTKLLQQAGIMDINKNVGDDYRNLILSMIEGNNISDMVFVNPLQEVTD